MQILFSTVLDKSLHSSLNNPFPVTHAQNDYKFSLFPPLINMALINLSSTWCIV